MLAGGLALGLGGRKIVERRLESKDSEKTEKPEAAAWKHL